MAHPNGESCVETLPPPEADRTGPAGDLFTAAAVVSLAAEGPWRVELHLLRVKSGETGKSHGDEKFERTNSRRQNAGSATLSAVSWLGFYDGPQ